MQRIGIDLKHLQLSNAYLNQDMAHVLDTGINNYLILRKRGSVSPRQVRLLKTHFGVEELAKYYGGVK
jgi:hypothetical protein